MSARNSTKDIIERLVAIENIESVKRALRKAAAATEQPVETEEDDPTEGDDE